MAFPVTEAQKSAFLNSHEMDLRVTVIRGTQSLGDIKIIEGSVDATYGTQGGRDAMIVVDANVIRDGLLDPNSDEVIIRTGITGVVEVPLFTGRVDELSEESTGQVRVTLESRGVEAIRARFEQPWAAGPVNTQARYEIQKILQSINPLWGVDVDDANSNTIPTGLVWEIDPGQALDQLALGASLIWQPDRSGGFRVYTNPYSVGPLLGAEPVVTLRDGYGGCTVQVAKNTSRDGVWNSVTVITERVDNTEPIRVTVRDNTVGSPTRWGGLFGKQNLVIKSQTPISRAQSQDLAVRILRQSLALQRSFSITLPDMPLLDPGDVFTLWYQDVVYSLVVEGVAYSVTGQELTRISARELVFIGDYELL